MSLVRALWNDDAGAVISAELVLVLTVLVLGMIVGMSEVAVAVNTELNDLSNAFGSLNQSYAFSGFHAVDNCKTKSFVSGSSFKDMTDDCDLNGSCDLVCGPPSMGGEGMGGKGD
jgi:Flp pilus assembly pilin Flp